MFITFVPKIDTMKIFIKTPLIRIVALAALIVCLPVSCGEKPEKVKTLRGTITANKEGEIQFMYSRLLERYPESCTFTTNLPAPDDQFVLTIPSGESTVEKKIAGLNAGQKVTWTATVEGNPLNHGSDNFVHIINN
jgi:hypothetical protein